MTQMAERIENLTLTPDYEPDDPNKKAHVIGPAANRDLWAPGMEAQDVVNLARDLQIELTALCGHVFIPKHNPENHDLCQPCIKIWDGMPD